MSVALHISGSIDHMTMISGTHLHKDDNSSCVFSKNFINFFFQNFDFPGC